MGDKRGNSTAGTRHQDLGLGTSLGLDTSLGLGLSRPGHHFRLGTTLGLPYNMPF